MRWPIWTPGQMYEEITTGRGFGARVVGAIRLDGRTYEDVEHDRTATGQAMFVVLLSSLSTSLGTDSYRTAVSLASGLAFALLGWFLWAGLTYLIGTRILPQAHTRAGVGELMRTTGFAAAPGVFGLLGVIPGAGPIILFGVSVWMLMAMVVAVRQALDFTSPWRALGVVVIGWAVYLAILGGLAMVPGAFDAAQL